MDRLDSMAAFVAVAELRGFAAAARRLKLSPSAVTRSVAALEERLGTRLLQRTTRSVTLTDAGSRYLERARRIVSDVAEADGAAQAERTVPTGRFVVAAPTVFGRLHVAPLLCRFLKEYPALSGELLLSDRLANLVEDGIDAAVRIGVLADSSLVARNVGVSRRVLIAAPKYLSRRKVPRRPEDLRGNEHDAIHCSALSATAEWHFTRDGKVQRVPFTPRFSTNSIDAAIAHAELGGGVTTVLAYQVVEAVRAGRLRVLLPEFELEPAPIQVVYPTTRLLSAKVRAFVERAAGAGWRFVAL
ncbi:MAG TPA: LysR family transcriptional regulator [Polyangiaceae bacterium]|jgi:DNA-binding transcriptional LysR family regulator|nr:LysR family transcriptional regulator [Polyangiaceae bacterium]